MLTLPSVPADNLYKFVAIAGLATAIVAVALEVQCELSFTNSVNEFSKQERKLTYEAFRTAAIRDLPQEIKDDYDARSRDLLDDRSHAGWLILAARIGLGIQFAFCVFVTRKGFNLWWDRCQQYQDAILKSQYKKEIGQSEDLQISTDRKGTRE